MPRSSRVPLIILLIGLALAVVEGAGLYARSLAAGHPMHAWHALRTGLGLWLTMTAVTPLPIWMAGRFPFERGRVTLRVALHLLAAIAFVTLHLLLDIGIQTLQGNMRPEPLVPHLFDLLGNYLATEMVVYAAVAGAFMFVRTRAESEARAVAAESLRAQLSEARLAALRLQLAPHFLFNTLNAVSTLVLRGDTDASCRSITLLADLLRRVLDESPHAEVTLAEELAFVALYIELQQLRFDDRLDVRWDIDPDARGAMVPRLLLQPIVENAIGHGLGSERGGEVALSARRENGDLRLEVSDRAHEPKTAEAGVTRRAHSGIGLVNTRERLATLYGDAHSLDLTVGPWGAAVCIRIPFRAAPPGSAA
jgi:type II secretory pathway pseudopilin PulG